jgi:glycosyltransferase involved in cell wall biosynthesis
MSAPRVSVILPTRNRAAVLPRAVRSVLDQTFAELELIVVDDGSSDDTESVIAEIADPRLVYVRLDEHRGAAAARNAGIKRARGELIAFQDSDDEWLPAKLERQVALLTDHSELGAVGGRYTIDAGLTSIQIAAPRLEAGRDYETELLEGECLITPVWLIQRPILFDLGLFDERMPCLEDWDLILRLSRQVQMRAVPEIVLIKRGAGDNLGGDVSRRAPAMEELLRRHGSRFEANRRRHAGFCLELSYLSLASRRRGKAVRYALRALRRGGATRQMLSAYGRACFTALPSGSTNGIVPGLAEAERQAKE